MQDGISNNWMLTACTDRPVQYKEMRKEMSKVYDVSWPVCSPYKDKSEITLEERKLW